MTQPFGVASTEDQFRLLVQVVQDYAIFMLNPEGLIVDWNEGAQRIKGYTAEEIVGQHFRVFYPGEHYDPGFPDRALKVAEQEGRFENEGWRRRKDESLFWANVVITALRDEAGALVGFAKVTRDLTNRRAEEHQRIEDARRGAADEAAKHARSEFLTSMSHELRTPLNAIAGYVGLILEGIYGPVGDKQREQLQRIQRRQQHLLKVVTDLLDYSKIAGGKFTYDIGPVRLDTVHVTAVWAMIEPQARRKGLLLERAACPAHAVARADRERTEQILLNLLSNAVKFTPSGSITVSCASLGVGRTCG